MSSASARQHPRHRRRRRDADRAQWVGRSGRARKLRGARITASHPYPVGLTLAVEIDPGMFESGRHRCLRAIAATRTALRPGYLRGDWPLVVLEQT
jgi:hypothetical protein